MWVAVRLAVRLIVELEACTYYFDHWVLKVGNHFFELHCIYGGISDEYRMMNWSLLGFFI